LCTFNAAARKQVRIPIAMKMYERYDEEQGDYYARFHQDPYRPDWFPMVGGT
jgi:hypothetical protein